MSAIVDLADAVRAQLATITEKAFERRYVPYFQPSQVIGGKWFVAFNSESRTTHRYTDDENLKIDICYQRGLPDSTDEYEDPLLNLPFLDACMAEVETVKTLYREGGELRKHKLANCVFLNMENSPLYNQLFLIQYQIFTSVIQLEYYNEGPDEDD